MWVYFCSTLLFCLKVILTLYYKRTSSSELHRHILVLFVMTQSHRAVSLTALTDLKWKTTKLCLSELETVLCE